LRQENLSDKRLTKIHALVKSRKCSPNASGFFFSPGYQPVVSKNLSHNPAAVYMDGLSRHVLGRIAA
jgi:hypothetical protein